MFCSNCGAKLEDGVKFCPECGTKVLVANQSPEINEPEIKEVKETESVQSEKVVEEEIIEEVIKEESVETDSAENTTNFSNEEPVNNENAEKVDNTGIFDGVFDFSDNTKTAIQAVSAFFVLSFIGHFITNFFGGIGDVISTVSKTGRPLASAFWLLSSLLKFAVGASSLGIIIVLLVIIFEWDEERTQKYFITVFDLAILVSLVSLLRGIASILFSVLYYSNAGKGNFNTFWSIFGTAALMALVFYGLSVGFKLPLFEDLSETNVKEKAIEAPKDVYKIATRLFSEKKAILDAKKKKNESSKADSNMDNQDMNSSKAYAEGKQKPFIPLKTDRSLFILIILSCITCGIYDLFFLNNMISDVNTACEGDGEETPGLFALIFLSLITCGIYTYVWHYKLGNRLQTNGTRYGIPIQENGTSVILWMLVGSLLCGFGPLIATYILIKNTNIVCAAYNNYNYNN